MGKQHSAVKPGVILLLLPFFLLLLPQSARSRCLAQTSSWGDRSLLLASSGTEASQVKPICDFRSSHKVLGVQKVGLTKVCGCQKFPGEEA